MHDKQSLNDGLYLYTKTCAISEEEKSWRITVSFMSDSPDKSRLVKDVYIWVTNDYLSKETKYPADIKGASQFAMDKMVEKYNKAGHIVPIENGISFSIEEGEIIVDPRNYTHTHER